MIQRKNIYCLLMILLLFLFYPIHLNAQDDGLGKENFKTAEEELLMELNEINNNVTNSNISSRPTVNFKKSASFIDKKRNEALSNKKQNVVRMYMNGTENTGRAVQMQGKGNVMDIGIHGNSNTGLYSQKGRKNYIYDRIGQKDNPVQDVTHIINQKGKGLGIYNEGMQTVPMIIQQKGKGMKLKITGPSK
jgi:hypothetical protein